MGPPLDLWLARISSVESSAFVCWITRIILLIRIQHSAYKYNVILGLVYTKRHLSYMRETFCNFFDTD